MYVLLRFTITDSFNFPQVDEPNAGSTIELINAYGELTDWTTETVEAPLKGRINSSLSGPYTSQSVKMRPDGDSQCYDPEDPIICLTFFPPSF
jgi:hypothetical protein|eukprot:evm.model.NODE_26024_length_17010_cov_77.754318.4